MRRISLLFALLAFSVFTFGQVQMVEVKSKQNLADKTIKTQVQNSLTTTKIPGEVFWTETFDEARWSASVDPATNTCNDTSLMPVGTAGSTGKWTVYDGNGENFYWHWSQLFPRGRYTSYDGTNLLSSLEPSTDTVDWLYSETRENGVMMLESDFFNTGPTGEMVTDPIDMDAYIMSPAIDVSGRPGVGIRFSERFRYCCSSSAALSIWVSGDFDPNNPDAAHWTEYDVKMGILTNKYPAANPMIYDADISESAVGYDQIYIKWHQTASSHYIWMIDDVELYEPFVNNVVLKNTWADYMYLPLGNPSNPDRYYSGGYTFIPKDIVDSYVQFRGSVNNFGTNTQNSVTLNVQVVKNGIDEAPVYDQTSPSITLANGATDTCFVSNDFTPVGVGNYKIKYHVASENTDENPANNDDEFNFEVSTNMYARNTMNKANFGSVSPGGWVGADIEGAQLGLLYNIPSAVTVSSITTYISSRNDSAGIANEDFMVIGHLMGVDAEGNYVPIAQSEQYVLNLEDRGNFLTLPFRDDGNLNIEEGDYYVALEFFTNTPNGVDHIDFYIGEDITVPFAAQSNGLVTCPLFSADWGWVIANPVMTLNIVATDVPMANVTFNVNMQPAIDNASFDPATDSVFIVGSFNDYGYNGMANTKGTIYSYTTTIPVGDYIKYYYCINKGEPDGYKFTTVYGGFSYSLPWGATSIKMNPELAKIKIGPNPVNSELTVRNLNMVSKIEVSNVLGQVIYTVNNPAQYVHISTANLSKGVYMITFTANDNTSRTERFVKE